MSFSSEWDQTYRDHKQLSIWPWSDLVSYVMRYTRPHSREFKVLELGFGAGANIRFFKELGVQYFGTEGSPSIVEEVKKQFPELNDKLVACDFTKEIPFEGPFDLVVDRSSVTHNSTASIKTCLNMVQSKMKPGAFFIGIDWFSTNHSAFKIGKPVHDEFTRTDFESGQFKGVGEIHFSTEEHLRDLFSDFKMEQLEEKIIVKAEPKEAPQFASWNLLARNG